MSSGWPENAHLEHWTGKRVALLRQQTFVLETDPNLPVGLRGTVLCPSVFVKGPRPSEALLIDFGPKWPGRYPRGTHRIRLHNVEEVDAIERLAELADEA